MRQSASMSTNTSERRPRLVAVNRRQMVMRAVDGESLIEEDHPARSIWELVGRLDLSRYYAEIAAVEGRAGREHTDPQVLISLWVYAYSRGISSGREMAGRCEYEPAFQWLCGLEPISHRTLSGFRSSHKAALDDLFVQVLGMLSAEGLITLERVTLDGTKIKANAVRKGVSGQKGCQVRKGVRYPFLANKPSLYGLTLPGPSKSNALAIRREDR